MADIEVLTENAAQVTAGKKYGARPTGADKDALLAEMRSHRANNRYITNTTKAGLALAAVAFALTRTEYAGIHTVPQLPNRLTKRTDISRQKRHSFVSRIVFEAQQVYAELL